MDIQFATANTFDPRDDDTGSSAHDEPPMIADDRPVPRRATTLPLEVDEADALDQYRTVDDVDDVDDVDEFADR